MNYQNDHRLLKFSAFITLLIIVTIISVGEALRSQAFRVPLIVGIIVLMILGLITSFLYLMYEQRKKLSLRKKTRIIIFYSLVIHFLPSMTVEISSLIMVLTIGLALYDTWNSTIIKELFLA